MWIFWVVTSLIGYGIMAGITIHIMERVGYGVGRSEREGGATIATAACWWFCLFIMVPITMTYQYMCKRQERREERRRRRQKEMADQV